MASDVENAEFRGQMRAHMETTATGITEIKKDVRRQAEATDSLRVEMTAGFGQVGERIAKVESAQEAHEASHEASPPAPRGRGRDVAVGGSSAGLAVLLREVVAFFKGGVS